MLLSNEGEAIFYDLGSGFGKPCLAAALALPTYFKNCVGIEYLDGLYKESLSLQSTYNKYRDEHPD